MLLEKSIDIKENDLLKIDPELLSILLKDKTTGKNIIWATDNYSKYGFSYSAEKEIKIELITSRHGEIIKPRIEKSKIEQQQRVRQKAEVFTPSWICNMQNNKVDMYGYDGMWNKLQSRHYCEKVMPLFGVTSVEQLITMVKTHSVSREYSYPGLFTKIPSIPWQFKKMKSQV